MLPVILTATFMASFDYMVVNVAAPSLARDLNAGPAALELVIGGYAFTYASGLVTGGRLGDLFGYKTMFVLGMASFTVASALCGLAGTSGQLVGARLLQGLTAAAMVPQVLALITAGFPVPERPRALSWFGVVLGLGGIAGQVIGGLLMDADVLGLGWRAIFLVNVPIGVIAAGLALRWLPGGRAERRPRLDPLGVIGISGSLALALVPLALGRSAGWPAWTWISLAGSVPAIAATLAWERRLTRRGGQPLLDLSLFGSRSFTVGLAINVAFMASFSSLMLALTLLLQNGLALSPLRAGLTFGPMAVVAMIISIAGRTLVARYGMRVLVAGSAISGLGTLGLAVSLHAAGSGVNAGWLMVPLSLVGLGNGLTLPSLIGVVLVGVRPTQAGAASGVLTTTQQFSGAAGIAVLGAVFFSVLGSRTGRGDFANAAEVTLWLDLVLIAATTGLVALLPRSAQLAPRQTQASTRVPAASVRS
jgi:EmrB/QacA subfamily drug resistance transporter